MNQLLTVEPTRTWTGTRALTIQTTCPTCDQPYQRHHIGTQDALLVHGGYGAATDITVTVCDCTARIADLTSTRPPRRTP